MPKGRGELHIVDPSRDFYTNMLSGALLIVLQRAGISEVRITKEEWEEALHPKGDELRITQTQGEMVLKVAPQEDIGKVVDEALKKGKTVVAAGREFDAVAGGEDKDAPSATPIRYV